jgi:hypothetical protein
MNSKFFKGILLMASVIFTALQTGNVVWISTILSAVLVGVGYYVKNYLLPSNSIEGSLTWRDILSGVLLAVVAGLSDSISSLIVNGVIVWPLLGKTVLTVTITYFTATFFSGQLTTTTATSTK